MTISKITLTLTASLLALGVGMLALPQAVRADGTPECNNGVGSGSTECGTNAVVGVANQATSVGNGAHPIMLFRTGLCQHRSSSCD